jgi:hypothetical protein
MVRIVAEPFRVPRPSVTVMQTFETTDPKLAQRCRFSQYRGVKKALTVNGSLVVGIVHSVKEVKSSSPTRWVVTVVAKRSIAA